MLGHTMLRSRLAGLAGVQVLQPRSFTRPIHLRIDPGPAVLGKLDFDWRTEIVTLDGVHKFMGCDSYCDCDNTQTIVRGKASLREKYAHNCNLIFTPEIPERRPRVELNAWKLHAAAALAIIEHEQRRAKKRAGISARWLVCLHAKRRDPFIVGMAFRLPKQENPKVFEECLRASGRVRGKFEVWPRARDAFWKRYIGELDGSL